MAPDDDKLKSAKFQMVMSASEIEAIDEVRYSRRIPSRAGAIRMLVQAGIEALSDHPERLKVGK